MEQNLSAQTLPNSLPNHRNVASDDDDDAPTLSLQALEALKEFLAEQTQSSPDTAAESRAADSTGPALISEDWRLSQFWYDPRTAQTLAQEVLTLCNSATASARVACVACPSLYAYLKVLSSFQYLGFYQIFNLLFDTTVLGRSGFELSHTMDLQ